MMALATACDRLYRPLVYNTLSHPIAIRVVWENGTADEYRVAPQQFLFAGIAESSVESLHVSLDGEDIQVLTAEDLRQLAGSAAVDDVALAIHEDGIKLMSESEVAEIRRSRGD
jgi:hypothetical protein